MDEKLRMRLLADIIEQIQDNARADRHVGDNLEFIDAVFYGGKGRKKPLGELGIARAMDCLMNDVFLFEDFDLRTADSVRVVSR